MNFKNYGAQHPSIITEHGENVWGIQFGAPGEVLILKVWDGENVFTGLLVHEIAQKVVL